MAFCTDSPIFIPSLCCICAFIVPKPYSLIEGFLIDILFQHSYNNSQMAVLRLIFQREVCCMKDGRHRYTIGEVAALLNISPQTLRFYDKSGVVVPDCTDQKTGYRYYSYDQISYISRVKYLQQFGFSLEEIREALSSNNTNKFKAFLQSRRHILQVESERIKGLLDDLDWYIGYYSYLEEHDYSGFPYRQSVPERYLLAEPLYPGEDIYGTAGKRLTQTQCSPLFSDAHFLRGHRYLLDFDALMNGKIVPTHYFVYLRQQMPQNHPHLMTIPAGAYLCVQARILSEPFDSSALCRYFKNRTPPQFVLANEYEDNFTNFQDCIYEIQIQS